MYTGYQHHILDKTPTEFRPIIQPLFDEYGVDLVIQGHYHAYEELEEKSKSEDKAENS